MGGFLGIGGGQKTKTPPPPKEDEGAKAKAEARRRLRSSAGYRSTIIGGMMENGLKAQLGG